MTHPTIHYLVNGPNPAPGVPIPTRGRAASLVDSMRVVGVNHVDHKPDNWVGIDYKVEDSLVKLILGGVNNVNDLNLAEQAIRAYLFAEYLEVFRPTAISFSKYGAWPHLLKSTNAHEFAYELFADIPSRDVLVVTSYVQVNDGIIVASKSGLVDLNDFPIEQLDSKIFTLDKALAHYITSISLPLCSYSGVSFEATIQPQTGHVDPTLDRLVKIIDRDWQAKVGSLATRLNGFVLPPFLASVLHRAENRDSIPDTLKQLRAEFEYIRTYLVSFEQEIVQSEDEHEISRMIQKFDDLFASVIPSTLEDQVYENRRPLLHGINVLLVACALYGYHDLATLGAASTALLKYLHEISLENNPNARRVSKSIVAGRLSEAFRVGSLKKLLAKHLHEEELGKLGY